MPEKRNLARRVAMMAVPALTMLAAGVPAQAATTRQALPGAKPAWTQKTPSQGNATGAVALRVYLEPKGGMDALKAAVTAVSTPGSATYGQFVTPAQFRQRFKPADATVAAVKQWLTAAGLKVDSVDPSGRFVAASGSPAAAGKAFGTSLKRFHHRGLLVRAPADSVTVPANVADAVAAVAGLDSTPQIAKHGATTKAPDAFVNGRPCSRSYGQLVARYEADFQTPLPKFNGSYRDYAICGYVPSQYRSAYLGKSKLTGQGVTVGIVDAYAADTIVQDANTYATRHGDPAFTAGQFTQNNSPTFDQPEECETPDDWAGEETLDVEAVHGIATGAKERYYGAKDCEDPALADSIGRAVNENKVSFISDSYGGLEGDTPTDTVVAYEQVILQGEMQGIGVLFSSGDDGDELLDSGDIQADYPASDPYVTAVGGTSAAIDANGALAFQTGWGTNEYTLSTDGRSWVPQGYLYGSGGGYSSLFNRPAYQNKVVPQTGDPGRAVPDIAMDGDPTTGMLVGETQAFPTGDQYGEYRIGGTSLSSPLFAGIQALASQSAGKRLGFANPAIYKQAKNNPARFLDVVPNHQGDANVRSDYVNSVDAKKGINYTLRTLGTDSSLFTAPGWDDVTGVGSPSPKYLTTQGR